MFNVRMAYPSRQEEEELAGTPPACHSLLNEVIMTKEELGRISDVVASIPMTRYLTRYVVRVVRATRPEHDDSPSITKSFVSLGAGPRTGQHIIMGAKALAMLEGRISADAGDIRRAALPVLRHRIVTNAAAAEKGMTAEQIVTTIVNDIIGQGSRDSTSVKKKGPTKKFVARKRK
jgi:MoxR-like ATPase